MTETSRAHDFIDAALEVEGHFCPSGDAPLATRAVHLMRRRRMAHELRPCAEHFTNPYGDADTCGLPEGHAGDHYWGLVASHGARDSLFYDLTGCNPGLTPMSLKTSLRAKLEQQ